MATHSQLFIGIDVGTGGVRTLAVSETGDVAARRSVPLATNASLRADGVHEQAPAAWWDAVCEAARKLMADLNAKGVETGDLKALATDGTSGTLVCLDAACEPVRPAIMYNDPRPTAEADELNALAGGFCAKLGYRFAASYALAKIRWVQRHEPEVFEASACLVHQADYILGRMTGEWGVSDYSNALKTGYDLVEERWPDWIEQLPGVTDRLPRVVAPGTPVGQVCRGAAIETGLPTGLTVVAGATDGTAACLASGVRRPGDYNTTLGTTLVFKGVSRRLCSHPDGLIYSHKLPGGFWLPGAASNTGAEWINALFSGEDLPALDATASDRLPTGYLAYPLARKGERFPFLSAIAQGFCVPEPGDEVERYAACLQGTALVERLAYDVLDEATRVSGGKVFSTGGGTASDVWTQCRADATGRTIHRPTCPESAFGSAVLAAAGTVYPGLWEAVEHMDHTERTFVPDERRSDRYDELFDVFCAELAKRGYR